MKPKRIYHEGFKSGVLIPNNEILKIINDNIDKTNMEILARSRYSDGSESMDVRIIISNT